MAHPPDRLSADISIIQRRRRLAQCLIRLSIKGPAFIICHRLAAETHIRSNDHVTWPHPLTETTPAPHPHLASPSCTSSAIHFGRRTQRCVLNCTGSGLEPRDRDRLPVGCHLTWCYCDWNMMNEFQFSFSYETSISRWRLINIT